MFDLNDDFILLIATRVASLALLRPLLSLQSLDRRARGLTNSNRIWFTLYIAYFPHLPHFKYCSSTSYRILFVRQYATFQKFQKLNVGAAESRKDTGDLATGMEAEIGIGAGSSGGVELGASVGYEVPFGAVKPSYETLQVMTPLLTKADIARHLSINVTREIVLLNGVPSQTFEHTADPPPYFGFTVFSQSLIEGTPVQCHVLIFSYPNFDLVSKYSFPPNAIYLLGHINPFDKFFSVGHVINLEHYTRFDVYPFSVTGWQQPPITTLAMPNDFCLNRIISAPKMSNLPPELLQNAPSLHNCPIIALGTSNGTALALIFPSPPSIIPPSILISEPPLNPTTFPLLAPLRIYDFGPAKCIADCFPYDPFSIMTVQKDLSMRIYTLQNLVFDHPRDSSPDDVSIRCILSGHDGRIIGMAFYDGAECWTSEIETEIPEQVGLWRRGRRILVSVGRVESRRQGLDDVDNSDGHDDDDDDESEDDDGRYQVLMWDLESILVSLPSANNPSNVTPIHSYTIDLPAHPEYPENSYDTLISFYVLGPLFLIITATGQLIVTCLGSSEIVWRGNFSKVPGTLFQDQFVEFWDVRCVGGPLLRALPNSPSRDDWWKPGEVLILNPEGVWRLG